MGTIHTTRRRTPRAVLADGASVLALVALAGLASCNASSKAGPSTDPQAANGAPSGADAAPGTGLKRLASDGNANPANAATSTNTKPTSTDLAAMAEENARLMREIREGDARKTAADPQPGTRSATQPGTPVPSASLATLSPGSASPGPSASTETGSTPDQTPTASSTTGPATSASASPAADHEAKVSAAADELARSLRDRAVGATAPLRDYLALAWLDAVRPGSLGALDSGPAATRIDPSQARSISLARDFAQALYGNPDSLRDPERVWAALQRAAEPVLSARDLSIAAADLCSRVDGYGQYAPITSRTFQAGVAHSIVVYTEVENFAHRATTDPGSGGERFAVDLGVAVEVWQDADKPTLQKRWSEAGVTETSRRKRRDFFVTNLIELPKALTVGAYTLKIIVNDRVKGALAEKVIPFTIVADPTTSQPAR